LTALRRCCSVVKDMSREDGDAPLTPLGLEQADQLGTFYAPLLEHKAREGKLHLFVSPQRRTCQTASPLFGRLNAATGIRAHARVELHETGPPTHSKNDPLRRQADALRQQLIKAGELSAVEIEREYNSRMETFRDAWVPTGMSGVVMRDEFPWVEPPPTNGLEGLPLAEDEPWMNYGPETHAHALLRAQSNADWLLGLARDLQNDELVVCVSHGAIMGLTVRCLLGMAERTDVGFGDLPNTGVHVINLPRPGPPAANVFGMAQQPNLLTMEVFASTVRKRKRSLLSTFHFRPTVLPRQAWDKHKNTHHNDRFRRTTLVRIVLSRRWHEGVGLRWSSRPRSG
jgi:broad specificity phosphatase PhoE